VCDAIIAATHKDTNF